MHGGHYAKLGCRICISVSLYFYEEVGSLFQGMYFRESSEVDILILTESRPLSLFLLQKHPFQIVAMKNI